MKSVAAVILAAGQGRRMRSSLPKVAHPVAGKPMVWHVAQAARAAGIGEIVFVLGHGRDKLAGTVAEFGGKVAVQERQLGTGDAARAGLAEVSAGIREVVVLCGDAPLIRPATVRALVRARRRRGAAATVLTGVLPDPTGYGRIVRKEDGTIGKIVEERDANAAVRALREVNSGTYAFDRAFLARNLPRLSDVNAQREFYLTDLVVQALQEGQTAVAVPARNPDEIRGINSRRELAEATEIIRRVAVDALLEGGVTIVDPARLYVEPGVSVGADTVIEPDVWLSGCTRIGRGARIRTGCVVEDSRIGDGTQLRPYSIVSGARVGKGCIVGPFAHLRPETDLADEVHIGNFVEVKKSRLGRGSKANHLAYLGDATVGRKVNVGAGTITCNFDGINKNRTVVGDGVFIGSDTMLVAPLTVGKGALVGAGSTITKDVPPYALALERAEQKNVEGWVARKRPELLAKAGLKVPRTKKKAP